MAGSIAAGRVILFPDPRNFQGPAYCTVDTSPPCRESRKLSRDAVWFLGVCRMYQSRGESYPFVFELIAVNVPVHTLAAHAELTEVCVLPLTLFAGPHCVQTIERRAVQHQTHLGACAGDPGRPDAVASMNAICYISDTMLDSAAVPVRGRSSGGRRDWLSIRS